MIDSGYSPEELEWLEANRDTVRAMIAASPRQMVALREEIADPVTKAAKGLISTMKSNLQQIDAKVQEVLETIENYRGYIERDQLASKEPVASFVDYVAKRGPDKLASLAAHKEALARKISALQSDPEACFLPIGTVVSFIGVPTYEDSLGLGDDRKSYPVEGSVGVVTRIRQKGEYALGVSMRKPFRDGWNTACEPDYDRMPTYKVDREMVDVVCYGLLPTGEEYHGFGFQATYERQTDSDDEDGSEMILEADGHFWRFHDFGGEQSIEALQAFDDLSEMPWLGGPSLEARRTPPSGPKP
ncbi:hypothetical protein OIU34_17760 [Pararhizobium sp. BT-229]|uniref:hypothetical protein n=1 Tax=Pararhizobium sp. BT-229 TaxID=2986923 RepID=UPI0021F6AC79|nr:hypothetical protein [Pararhizobium sp. BT-229]MCV9963725.1 hypothetical protein [Pararhizobium sp. BT-229]